MAQVERRTVFWDMVEGRIPRPPSVELLGWHLEAFDEKAGTVTVRFDARPEFANMLGNVQGGFLAAMLDDTMGPAFLVAAPDEIGPTLEMKVSFFEPAKVGPLWGHGRVVKRGRTNAFVEADLTDADGTLIARSTATLRVLPAGH